MQIISYAEARDVGLKRYYTGKPCASDHVAERYVCNRKCVACQSDLIKKSRATNPDKWREYGKISAPRSYRKHWARRQEMRRAYEERNAEKTHADRLRWQRENLARRVQQNKVWRNANQEKARAYSKKWREENKAAVDEKRRRRQAAHMLRAPAWANKDAMRAVYREARRRTKSTGIPHHVDHVIPLQGKLVSGLHVETNLQILTAYQNVRKHNRFDEVTLQKEAVAA